MTKHVLLLAFLISANLLHAQKEYDKWYFGNQAAIDFSSGTATALLNSSMDAIDNPASISDSLGNLLFYSDGIEVYNRNHILMPNGSGLLGSLSGGHTATAVRKPGSSNLYYLFTLDAFASSNGLRYNIIDMNLNGGLGDIVSGQKNIVLLNPASEQIVPVVHANGNDIWIVTHPWNSSSFNSYLITCSGLNISPVVSTVGNSRSGSTNNAPGQINISAQNNRIATVTYGTGTFELFDFNNATGVLSNPLSFSGYNNPWSVEFSADGSKLYLNGWTTQYVYQFDITTYTQLAISASQINLGNVTGPGSPYFTGYMQRGPDNKIYIAVYLDSYLAVINNPNVAGAGCNLVDDGFDLGTMSSSAGLPNKVVVTHGSLTLTLGPDTSYCGNFTQILTTGNANTLWSTGITAAQITVSTPGIYWASTSGGCGNSSDTIVISGGSPPPPVLLPNDTSYCGNFSQTLSTGNANTVWSTGATASQITITTTGTYWAQNSNACGTTRDSIVISTSPSPIVNLGNDTALCAGHSLILNASTASATYHWQNSSVNATLNVSTAGTYAVTVTTSAGCTASDAINVTQYSLSLTASATNAGCGLSNGTAMVVASNGNAPYNFNWSNSVQNYSLQNLAQGSYTVTVMDNGGCSATASVFVDTSGIGSVQITSNISTPICSSDSVHICAPSGYQNYLWNTGQSSTCIYTSHAGNYYVTVTDNTNCTSSSNHITVTAFPLPSVSISVNGNMLTAFNATSYQWFFNGNPISGATADTLLATQQGNYTLQITDSNGCNAVSNIIFINTAINDFSNDAEVNVFPNPNQNSSWQINSTALWLNAEINLFDVNGSVVFKSILKTAETKMETDLPRGVYLLKIISGEKNCVKKLVRL